MAKYIILVFSLLCFLSCSFFDKKEAEKHYKNALNFEESKKLDSALIEIDMAISLCNTNKDYSIRKAKILRNLEFYEKSNEILLNLFTNDSNENTDEYVVELTGTGVDSINLLIADNYYSIAHKMKIQSDGSGNSYFHDCIRYCDFVINNDYKNYDAYATKRIALHNLEQYIESLGISNEMIKIFPDSTSNILYRGVTKVVLEDLDGGIDDLNAYIKIGKTEKKIALAYRFLAMAYDTKRNYTKAIEHYTKSIELDADAYTYENRAATYVQLGNYESACKDLRKASDMGHNTFEDIKRYCN